MAITPSWTDYVGVIPGTPGLSTTLVRGATVAGSLDLRQNNGAELFVRLGRTGTSAIAANGIDILVKRYLDNSGTLITHPAPLIRQTGQIAAANTTTITSTAVAGDQTIIVGSSTGYAVDDFVVINGGGAKEDWVRVGAVPDSTHLKLDYGLAYGYSIADAAALFNKADVYPPLWVLGGSKYEIIVDYLAQSGGDSVQVQVLAQVYSNDQTA